MKKIFIFLSLSIVAHFLPIEPMEPVETKGRWLILGAGTENDAAGWDEYTKAREVEWIGFNEEAGPKAIVGDFNKPEDLDKLEDNTYDKIFFDWSTTKFVRDWDKQILEVLYKKLTYMGELLLMIDHGSGGSLDGFPQDEALIRALISAFDENPTYENYKLLQELQAQLEHLIQVRFGTAPRAKETLFFGCRATSLSRDMHSTTSYRVYEHYRRRYYEEVNIQGNISLLQSIFGKNVQLRKEKPHPFRSSDTYCVSHYRAVKSSEETVKAGSEIDTSPYNCKIGDYTIKGRYLFPVEKASDECDAHYCFVDAEKNIYYVEYPDYCANFEILLAFVNKVLGRNFVELHGIDGFLKRSNGPIKLSDLPLNAGTDVFGLGGPYGLDIPWQEYPFEFQDVPVIEHNVTRDQLSAVLFSSAPARAGSAPVTGDGTSLLEPIREDERARRTLWERILRSCSCFRRNKVMIV